MTGRGEEEVAAALLSGLDALDAARRDVAGEPALDEVGQVTGVARGVATVTGLPGAFADETVTLGRGAIGLVADLREKSIGVVLLAGSREVHAGAPVRRTGRVLDVPVGDALLGRVIDPLGSPLDGAAPVESRERLPIERPATPINDRAPVRVPLQTGVKVVDALFPIGRGQRELIVGDRQTGKTSVALSAILAQRETGVLCVYCSVGRRGAEVARTVATLRRNGSLAYTTVVVASSEAEPGLRQIAPFAAMSVAEAWMQAGRDVLVILDDLVQHARAHREVSLLLRRPPGREAYPGDIFYLHSRLLERATQLKDARGGGSLTALPIVETQERDLAAYVPTNLISITDGQIVLSSELFRLGQLPAVDIGLSVSRVGGKAQRPAYRAVAGGLRLSHAQFQELETFARLGAELDESTRETLTRGRRVREVLRQGALEPIPVAEQIAVLLGADAGVFDEVPTTRVGAIERIVRSEVRRELPNVCARIEGGESLDEDDRDALLGFARKIVASAAARA
ncbi:MAG: F0F1 ATP synthase subunit alpha [Burkholderiaceae bacterium]|nr:F0F1 ATP synthase subunit alpha [Burkholderiaceae bacterium]